MLGCNMCNKFWYSLSLGNMSDNPKQGQSKSLQGLKTAASVHE